MTARNERGFRFEEYTGLTARAALLLAVPSLLLIVSAFWLAAQFLDPMPPRRIVFAGGPEGGAANALVDRYRRILARDGITVEVRPTLGPGENIGLLAGPKHGVDVALMVAGTAKPPESDRIVNVSNILLAPLWGLSRGPEPVTALMQLGGRRVAIGLPGTGIDVALAPLLEANGVSATSGTLLHLTPEDSVRALATGEADAIFLGEGLLGKQLREALEIPGVKLMSFERADAYARRFPHLVRLELPAGTIDLVRNLPDRNLVLIGTTVMLAARADLHPTVIDLLVDAAREIHGGQGLFERRGEFPHLHPVDAVPVSEQALQYAREGPSFLRRFLPLWLAEFLQRAFTLAIPVVAVVLPLTRLLPSAINVLSRRYVYVAYAEMRRVERKLRARPAGAPVDDLLEEIDRIEDRIAGVRESVLQAAGLYTLRTHVQVVRATIAARVRDRRPTDAAQDPSS